MAVNFIKAKIIGIEPGTYDKDKVYDQYVFIKLPNQKTMDLFDHKMVCSREMIGETRSVVIDVPLSRLEKISESRKEIIPVPKTDNPTGQGHIFYGIVKKFSLDEEEYLKAGFYSGENIVVLDVGVGEILFSPEEDHPKFQVGDYLKVLAVRTDLSNVL